MDNFQSITNRIKNKIHLQTTNQSSIYKIEIQPLETKEKKELILKVYNSGNFFHSEKDILEFLKINKDLTHPNIIQLLSYDEMSNSLLFEYMANTDIFEYMLFKRNEVSLRKKFYWIEAIAHGLKYIHMCGVIHHDIKLLNILVGEDTLTIKICDFGMACIKKNCLCRRGTARYVAPEIIMREIHNNSIDIYSFGVLLWELFSERMAYDDVSNADISNCNPFEQQLDPILPEAILRREKYSEDEKKMEEEEERDKLLIVLQVMSRCLSLQSDKRPTSAEILSLFLQKNSKVSEK